jgi:hypothetical protein
MCVICSMLENTWPGPKNLVRAIHEVAPSGKHIEEIIENVSRGLNDEERANLATELLKEALRSSP